MILHTSRTHTYTRGAFQRFGPQKLIWTRSHFAGHKALFWSALPPRNDTFTADEFVVISVVIASGLVAVHHRRRRPVTKWHWNGKMALIEELIVAHGHFRFVKIICFVVNYDRMGALFMRQTLQVQICNHEVFVNVSNFPFHYMKRRVTALCGT